MGLHVGKVAPLGTTMTERTSARSAAIHARHAIKMHLCAQVAFKVQGHRTSTLRIRNVMRAVLKGLSLLKRLLCANHAMQNAENVLMLQINVWHAPPGIIFGGISAMVNVLQQVLLWNLEILSLVQHAKSHAKHAQFRHLTVPAAQLQPISFRTLA